MLREFFENDRSLLKEILKHEEFDSVKRSFQIFQCFEYAFKNL